MSASHGHSELDTIRVLAAQIQASCAALHGGNGNQHSVQVQLFDSLQQLHELVLAVPKSDLRACQQDIEKTLRQVSFGDGASQLTATFHELLGRIWSVLYSRGDTRNLLEIVAECQTCGGNKLVPVQLRRGALNLLEFLFTSQGRALQGYLNGTYTVAKNIQKENIVSLRTASILALVQGVIACGPAGASQHRDITKLVLKTVLDKAPIVREASIRLAGAIVRASNRFTTVGSDALLGVCCKALSDQSYQVAHIAADIIAEMLYINIQGNPDKSVTQFTTSSQARGTSGTVNAQDEDSDELAGESSASKSNPAIVDGTRIGTVPRKTSMHGLTGLTATFSISRKKTSLTTWYTFTSAMEMLQGSYVSCTTHSARVLHGRAMAGLLNYCLEYHGLTCQTAPGDYSHVTSGGADKGLSNTAVIRSVVTLALSLLEHPDVTSGKANLQPITKSILGGMAIGMGIGVPSAEALREATQGGTNDAFDDSAVATWVKSSQVTQTPGHDHRSVVRYILRCGIGGRLNEITKVDYLRRLVHVLEEVRSRQRPGKRMSGSDRTGSGRNSGSGTIIPGQGAAARQWCFNANQISCALAEISQLLSSLGSGAGKVERHLQVALKSLMYHPSRIVRCETAATLRSFCLAMPSSLPDLALEILQMVGMIHADVSVTSSSIHVPASSPSGKLSPSGSSPMAALLRTVNALEGHVLSLCAVIHASIVHRFQSPRENAGYVNTMPSFIAVSVLGNSKALIARQYDRTSATHVSYQCAHTGWLLVSTLVTLGPEFCADQLSQLFGMWKEAFDIRELKDCLVTGNPETVPRIRCMAEACEALANFVLANGSLLEQVPSVLQSTVILLSAVADTMQDTPPSTVDDTPGSVELLAVHQAVFKAVSGLPRTGIAMFDPTVLSKLTSLALSYFGDGSIADNSLSLDGLSLNPFDAVLSRVIPSCVSDYEVLAAQPAPTSSSTSSSNTLGAGSSSIIGASVHSVGHLGGTTVRKTDGKIMRKFPIQLRGDGQKLLRGADPYLDGLLDTVALTDMETQLYLTTRMTHSSLLAQATDNDPVQAESSRRTLIRDMSVTGQLAAGSKPITVAVAPAGRTTNNPWDPNHQGSRRISHSSEGVKLSRLIPSHPVLAVQAVDSAILYFASQFSVVQDDIRDLQLATFVTTLKKSSNQKFRAARNTLTALSLAFETLSSVETLGSDSVYASHSKSSLETPNSISRTTQGNNSGLEQPNNSSSLPTTQGNNSGLEQPNNSSSLPTTQGNNSGLEQPNNSSSLPTTQGNNSSSPTHNSSTPPSWLGKAKGLLCAALSSPQPVVRRAASQGISALTKTFGFPFGNSIVETLSSQLGQPTNGETKNPSDNPFFRAGVVFVLGSLRRNVPDSIRYVRNNLVYDLCKGVLQPSRTWALYSWHLIVETAGMDIAKYVKPTIALIMAHLLDDGRERNGSETHSGMIVCLARLLNSLLGGLGPELVGCGDMEQLLRIWDTVRRWPCEMVQFECMRSVQLMAMFNPEVVANSQTIIEYCWEHLSGKNSIATTFGDGSSMLQSPASQSCWTQSMAAQCFVLLAKCDSRFATNYLLRNHMYRAMELHTREFQIGGKQTPVYCDGGGDCSIQRMFVCNTLGRKFNLDGQDITDSVWEYSKHCVTLLVEELSDSTTKLGSSTTPSNEAVDSSNVDAIKALQHRSLCEWLSFCRHLMVVGGSANSKSFWTPLHLTNEQELQAYDDGSSDSEDEGDIPKQRRNQGNAVQAVEDNYAKCVIAGLSSNVYSAQHKKELVTNPLLSPENEPVAETNLAVNGQLDAMDRLWGPLADCRWQTRLFAGRIWILLLSITREFNLEEHLSLELARKLVSDSQNQTSWGTGSSRTEQPSPRIVSSLIDVVTGACQVATSSVAGHAVPVLQHLGLVCIETVVDTFAQYPDPDDLSQSILRQYQAQLSSGIRPALASNTAFSPLLLAPASFLSVKMLVRGVLSSTSSVRVITSLLPDPDWLKKRSDSNSDDTDQDSLTEKQTEGIRFSERVDAEILLSRLQALGELYLASFRQIAPRLRVSNETSGQDSVRKPLASSIRKALGPCLNELVPLWHVVVRDTAMLFSALPKDITVLFERKVSGIGSGTVELPWKTSYVKHENSLFECVEDSTFLAPLLYSACWPCGQALALSCAAKLRGEIPAKLNKEGRLATLVMSLVLCKAQRHNTLTANQWDLNCALDTICCIWTAKEIRLYDKALLRITMDSLCYLLDVCRGRSRGVVECRAIHLIGEIAEHNSEQLGQMYQESKGMFRQWLKVVTVPVSNIKSSDTEVMKETLLTIQKLACSLLQSGVECYASVLEVVCLFLSCLADDLIPIQVDMVRQLHQSLRCILRTIYDVDAHLVQDEGSRLEPQLSDRSSSVSRKESVESSEGVLTGLEIVESSEGVLKSQESVESNEGVLSGNEGVLPGHESVENSEGDLLEQKSCRKNHNKQPENWRLSTAINIVKALNNISSNFEQSDDNVAGCLVAHSEILITVWTIMNLTQNSELITESVGMFVDGVESVQVSKRTAALAAINRILTQSTTTMSEILPSVYDELCLALIGPLARLALAWRQLDLGNKQSMAVVGSAIDCLSLFATRCDNQVAKCADISAKLFEIVFSVLFSLVIESGSDGRGQVTVREAAQRGILRLAVSTPDAFRAKVSTMVQEVREVLQDCMKTAMAHQQQAARGGAVST